MDGIVIASVVVLIVVLLGLSYLSYRRHSRAAEAKSTAALAQLLAEGEQLAARGLDVNPPSTATTPSSPPAGRSSVTDAPDAVDNAVQDAFERGYQQGFREGLLMRGSNVADKPTS
jgi:hypothetical protein